MKPVGNSARFAASTAPRPSRVVVEPRHRRVQSKRVADGADGEQRQVRRRPANATCAVLRRPAAAAPAAASDAEDQPLAVDNVEAGEPAARVEPMAAVAPGPPEGVEIFTPPGCRVRFLQPWDSLGPLGCSKCRDRLSGCGQCRRVLGWCKHINGCWELSNAD